MSAAKIELKMEKGKDFIIKKSVRPGIVADSRVNAVDCTQG